MGLDMYLYKETYVKRWSHEPKEIQYNVTVKRGGKLTGIKNDRIVKVVEEVGYWRKFNALHAWFVDNCQNGVDECQRTHVSIEKLENLLEILNRLVKDKKLAPELLPTATGFFFGSSDYDDWYWNNVKDTIKMLRKILNEDNSESYFYYQSSW